MLILSRGIGDAIMIGDQIELTVLNVKGNQVSLGITAPESVKLLRSELYVKAHRPDDDKLPSDIHCTAS